MARKVIQAISEVVSTAFDIGGVDLEFRQGDEFKVLDKTEIGATCINYVAAVRSGAFIISKANEDKGTCELTLKPKQIIEFSGKMGKEGPIFLFQNGFGMEFPNFTNALNKGYIDWIRK